MRGPAAPGGSEGALPAETGPELHHQARRDALPRVRASCLPGGLAATPQEDFLQVAAAERGHTATPAHAASLSHWVSRAGPAWSTCTVGPLFGEGLPGRVHLGPPEFPSTPAGGCGHVGASPGRDHPHVAQLWLSCPGREALGAGSHPPQPCLAPPGHFLQAPWLEGLLGHKGDEGPSCCPGFLGGKAAYPETCIPPALPDELGTSGAQRPPELSSEEGRRRGSHPRPGQCRGTGGPRGPGLTGQAHLEPALGSLKATRRPQLLPRPSSSRRPPGRWAGAGVAACRP